MVVQEKDWGIVQEFSEGRLMKPLVVGLRSAQHQPTHSEAQQLN
jgi:hypothetical protein